MQIWVDAHACPKVIKEVLFRAAQRTQTLTTLVANQGLAVPASPYIKTLQVPQGFDVADNWIVQKAQVGDLVITADIPLAAEVIDKGALALSPRGEVFHDGDIKARLTVRDLMDTLRSSGIQTGGPAPFNQADRMAFANALDKILAKAAKG